MANDEAYHILIIIAKVCLYARYTPRLFSFHNQSSYVDREP